MAINLPTMRKFVSPEIIFGVGSRHSVGNYAEAFGASKVLVVSDPGVVAAGWVRDALVSLEERDIDYVLYTNVTANPRSTEVMEGAALYNQEHCNLIVAVGGGSPMDCAKGIGIVSSNGSNILTYEGIDQIALPIPPLIFIPTTAGTSADVSQFCIISDRNNLNKISIVSKSVVPDVSLIDPETTSTMDRFLTACTGVDAMVHAIEAFVSTGSGPLTDSYALDAIEIIYANLNGHIQTPDDINLREKIMLGSMKAGLAFSNAILGANHAMAHSLGGMKDLAHGLCNAILIEHVIDFNFSSVPDKFRVIAQKMNIDCRGLNDSEVRNRIQTAVRQLKTDVGLRTTLAETGVSLSDIPILASKALRDPCILTNPRHSNKRDVEAVYEEAL